MPWTRGSHGPPSSSTHHPVSILPLIATTPCGLVPLMRRGMWLLLLVSVFHVTSLTTCFDFCVLADPIPKAFRKWDLVILVRDCPCLILLTIFVWFWCRSMRPCCQIGDRLLMMDCCKCCWLLVATRNNSALCHRLGGDGLLIHCSVFSIVFCSLFYRPLGTHVLIFLFSKYECLLQYIFFLLQVSATSIFDRTNELVSLADTLLSYLLKGRN